MPFEAYVKTFAQFTASFSVELRGKYARVRAAMVLAICRILTFVYAGALNGLPTVAFGLPTKVAGMVKPAGNVVRLLITSSNFASAASRRTVRLLYVAGRIGSPFGSSAVFSSRTKPLS